MIQYIKDNIIDLLNIDTYMQQAQNKYIMEYYAFYQTWSSTALGFDYPFAGSALTTAMTTVIKTQDKKWYVFFGGKIAYCLENPNEQFFEDLKKFNMKSCNEAKIAY